MMNVAFQLFKAPFIQLPTAPRDLPVFSVFVSSNPRNGIGWRCSVRRHHPQPNNLQTNTAE
ncbi:hypothetical protein PISMIDRAFT_559404 [Pisolithus microcarpus 441]|uniref:Uncharacterized protein n=1 Tax=Pisolithus microcarpus 441 TaxID=765257 RepID=A0A0D0AAE5_9AGAM|nr:hypothetical protein PISMIDRAFT_559404 [Pisolithus microcarpus 441]